MSLGLFRLRLLLISYLLDSFVLETDAVEWTNPKYGNQN